MTNESKKKQGFFEVMWESLTKTGGCCGAGETCGGPEKASEKPTPQENRESDERAKK